MKSSPRRLLSTRRVATIGLSVAGLAILLGGLVIFFAVTSNHGTSGRAAPGLDVASRRELTRLPYCAVAHRYGVEAETLAGVDLAEKQLNRDWSDDVQDALFEVLLLVRSENGWQRWADDALAVTNRALQERSRSGRWPGDVIWTGMIFSLGPSQITPRTAFRACRNAIEAPSWCGNPRLLVEALLDERRSLEVAALVLDDERKLHLTATGSDVSGDPGRWATLYNFGGEIFRSRFGDRPDRPANGFGQWVERNASQMRTILKCTRPG